ncbi:MAG: acetyl-CoA carboxylase carboxyltransferase subunit alpha [Deltaproteobacteria bacterium]|nr:acetyl-CoA carboxylase carboxyltransferase subunit alpha [Candidatus Zymogenaceae bacterium]
MARELKFERSIIELNKKIREMKNATDKNGDADLSNKIRFLEERAERLEENFYRNADRWLKIELSRLEHRPQMLDYVELVFNDYIELSGDRLFGDDKAVLGGLARIDGRRVMVVGNQKGRGLKGRLMRNFGMPHPEGYRKAMRLMRLAERFELPLITIVDTPGAYPGVAAEERGQSLALAESMFTMATLRTPILTVIIGEAGSGGALALAVADRVLMMENATYTVSSPEACASILWKDHTMKETAAEALKPTAEDNLSLGLIDGVITEPRGGAHRDKNAAAELFKQAVVENLREIMEIDMETRLLNRYERFRRVGIYHEPNGPNHTEESHIGNETEE